MESKAVSFRGSSDLVTSVDGRNPVDRQFIPLFTRFYTSQVVVWDFFHQLGLQGVAAITPQ